MLPLVARLATWRSQVWNSLAISWPILANLCNDADSRGAQMFAIVKAARQPRSPTASI
jgi:hypothetical protein